MQATEEGMEVAGNGYTACRNCCLPVPIKGRGLCNRCYSNRHVRYKFDKMPKDASDCGTPIGNGEQRLLPNKPTMYPPGSLGKIQVLCARALAGVSLWHPDDYPVCIKRSYQKG